MRLIDAPDLSRLAERKGGWLSSLPLRRDVDSDPPSGHEDSFDRVMPYMWPGSDAVNNNGITDGAYALGVRVEGAGLSGTGADRRAAA